MISIAVDHQVDHQPLEYCQQQCVVALLLLFLFCACI